MRHLRCRRRRTSEGPPISLGFLAKSRKHNYHTHCRKVATAKHIFWRYIYIYIYIPPPIEVQRPIMHPSQAPPSHTNTLGLLWRLSVRVSRLVVDLQASHRPSMKVRLNALWFISGLVGLFFRLVSLAYKSVWSCLFFRTVQSRSVCESALPVLVASGRICLFLVVSRSLLDIS